MTAALGLQREGIQCIVLEKKDILGGRARSWVDEKTGDPIHIGPHILLSEYPNMLKLLEIVGTKDKIVWERDHFMVQTLGAKKHVLKQAPVPSPFSFIPSLLSYPVGSLVDKASNILLSAAVLQMTEEDFLELDDENAYAYLKRMGVTDTYIDQFWTFTSLSIMNVPLDLCSAGALMRFFQKFLGYTEWYFGFTDGGLGEIWAPATLAAIQKAGGEVRTNTSVKELIVEHDVVKGVVLEDGSTIRARHTIMATEPQTFYAMGPFEWRRKYKWFDDLSYFHPCPYKSVFVWFDHKITDLRMWARCYQPGDLNCDFYDNSNIFSNRPSKSPNSMIASNIIFSDRVEGMSDEELVRQTVREISEVHPTATWDHVTHWVVNHVPMAIHLPYPGTEKRRPQPQVGVEGLILAGDYVQTYVPGCMESAVCSGWMAAEAILAERGKPKQLSVERRPIDGMAGLINKGVQYLPHRVARRTLRRLRNAGGVAGSVDGLAGKARDMWRQLG
ncbi:Phytoene dehydrogenase [gamma proteobacterium HdN1]|nr:Phytoene dehydrogenase [gamma proteobacterium HdN1]